MKNQASIPTLDKKKNLRTAFHIFLVLLLTAFILPFAGWLGGIITDNWELNAHHSNLLQGLIFSGVMVPVIWFLTKKYYKELTELVGFSSISKSFKFFILGFGLILFPMILTLFMTEFMGWGDVQMNDANSAWYAILVILLGVFLFEALPEELIFRGYIFTKLNTTYKKWMAAFVTVILFVLLPVLMVPIQQGIFGMDINLNGQNQVSGSYLVTMLFFGSFVQYLRIITNSVWTGIGFHLAFVGIDRLIGISSTDLIQITNIQNESGSQITLLISLLLILIGLIMYPIWKKKPIGWNQRVTKSIII